MAPPDHPPLPPELNRLTRETIAAGIEVHRVLGPGMLERIYQQALAHELDRRGFLVELEVPVVAPTRAKTWARACASTS